MMNDEDREAELANMAPLAFGLECGLAVATAVAGWMIGVSPYRTLQGLGENWVRMTIGGVFAALPALLFLAIYPRLNATWVHDLQRRLDRQILPLFAKSRPHELLLISIAAGFAEELLFRGLIQDGIQQWRGGFIGTTFAVVIASAVFGALHALTRAYAVLATIMGLYLGLLLIVTESLLVPIVAHTVYDWIAFQVLLRRWKQSGRRR